MLRIIFGDHAFGQLNIVGRKDGIKIRHIRIRVGADNDCLATGFQIINDLLCICLVEILLWRIDNNCGCIIRNTLLIEKFNAGQRHICFLDS